MSQPRRLDIEAAIELPRTLAVARTSGDSPFRLHHADRNRPAEDS